MQANRLEPQIRLNYDSYSPKAHFTVPRRVEGWVDLGGWLLTKTVYLHTDSRPSKY